MEGKELPVEMRERALKLDINSLSIQRSSYYHHLLSLKRRSLDLKPGERVPLKEREDLFKSVKSLSDEEVKERNRVIDESRLPVDLLEMERRFDENPEPPVVKRQPTGDRG